MSAASPSAVTAPAGLDGRELRNMFALFPTGVAIVTAQGLEADYIGATVSSFSSVSLDPPLVLFSMARTAKSFASWEAADSFAVNILSEKQREVSSQFARSSGDKWQGVARNITDAGLPLIEGAIGSLQCRTWARYDGGDHLIIVGEVFAATKSSAEKPLVFAASRYAVLADEG